MSKYNKAKRAFEEENQEEKGDAGLITNESITEYFANQISECLAETQLDVSPDVQFYVASLLTHFASNAHLIVEGVMEQPLAMLYTKALAAAHRDKIRLLRNLGDSALYISGFFADSLNRSMVDVDYYAQMGGKAYGDLSSIFSGTAGGKSFSSLYHELAVNIWQLIDLLNAISERSEAANAGQDSKSILKMYERWQKTKSKRLAVELHKNGFFPAQNNDDVMH